MNRQTSYTNRLTVPAQGRLLAVLLETTAPLALRRLARLAGVSPAQASRVMPRLVELGIVDRHEVPPASPFLLVRDCVVTQLLPWPMHARLRFARSVRPFRRSHLSR
jgi:predicted transcriptional regulator